MSSTARARPLLVLVVAVLGLAGVTSAVAAPPTPASGTFTYTSSSFNSIRSAGDNTIIDTTGTVSYTSTFTGTSTLQGTLIIHADGSAIFHDVETFTGTVNGVPGTVTFNLAGRNDSAGSRPGQRDHRQRDGRARRAPGRARRSRNGAKLQWPRGHLHRADPVEQSR